MVFTIVSGVHGRTHCINLSGRGIGPTTHELDPDEHETWIADIFSDLTPKDVRELMRLLAKTKASAQKSAQARAL